MDENTYENLDSIIYEGQHANHRYAISGFKQLKNEDKMMIDLEFLPSVDSSKTHYAYYQKNKSYEFI